MAKTGVVITIHCLAVGHGLQDCRHSKGIGDLVLFNQRKHLLGIKPLAVKQNRNHPPGNLGNLMNSSAVRERCDDQRRVLLAQTWEKIGKTIGDDKAHLPVCQHGSLGAPRRTGCEEEPAGIIVVDGSFFKSRGTFSRQIAPGVFFVVRLLQANNVFKRRSLDRFRSIPVRFEHRIISQHLGARILRDKGNFVFGQAKVHRDPNSPQFERRKHGFKHRKGIARLNKNAVALADAQFLQAVASIVDTLIEGGKCQLIATANEGITIA